MLPRRILFLAPAQTVTRIFPQLRDAGMEVGIAENLKGASAFMRKGAPSLILSRPFLPGYRIDDLLAVGQDDPHFPPVIVFSDRISAEEATRVMELGARDYWPEPLSFEKIQAALPPRPAAGRASSQPVPSSTLGGRKAEPALEPASGVPHIVGGNPTMLRVLALARQVAKSKATVLISGESGTGKEMFSRYLHAQSDRACGPFVAVNCAALPEHLLESELFGHEKGSFTGAIARKLGKFELAGGGTILLDEVSEMEPALQAKLLRVLQEGEIDRVGGIETIRVDVRVLATTNRNLEEWVREGKFRQDLFFRLNVIPLRLPALRERGDDVLTLARFFISMYVREYALPPVNLSAEAESWLMAYDWPGNVRELQNLMERAVLLSGGKPIAPCHFLLEADEWPLFLDEAQPQEDTADAQGRSDSSAQDAGASAPDLSGPAAERQAGAEADIAAAFAGGVIPLHEMERLMIKKGLEQTSGNRTQAAELLGISVRTLRNKLNEYRLSGQDVEAADTKGSTD
ncbi:sigma-54 dependent transcriptional regulator [Desulfovibrio sp. OttesenSCG-928-A18]|nr:sigma-54 dependent transcriptional regulator [Desulfovibrio sp. OttesenSCG-928-A18]